MEDRYIVAIDLGSSKIALTVARVEGSNVQVVYYSEHAAEGIDKSAVFNETQASRVLATAKEKAEEALGISITHAAVCMPRYYVKELTNQAEMDLDPEKAITIEDVQALMGIAKDTCEIENPETDVVYDCVAQSYSDGEQFQIKEEDIIGLEREKIEGNFKVFIGKKSSLKRIDSVFKKVDIIPVKYFTADITAHAVLSKAEMETGVALVEIGAGVTSVSIYIDKVMRYYASIPFGGKIVTSDIKQECGISEKLAENIKKGYGVCMPNKLQNLADKKLQIRSLSAGDDKQIGVKYLSEIITARMEEIVDAVLYLIQESTLYDELRSGIVLTGGGANLANLANLFYEKSGYNTKIGYPKSGFSFPGDCEGVHETGAAASVGMLLAAKETSTLSFASDGAPKPKPAPIFTSKPVIPVTPAKPKVEPAPTNLFENVAPEPDAEEIRIKEEQARKEAERKKKENERLIKEREKRQKEEEKRAKRKGLFQNLGNKIGDLFNEEETGA